jgi:hypothetical protein
MDRNDVHSVRLHLDSHGWAVINMFSELEVRNFEQQFWNWARQFPEELTKQRFLKLLESELPPRAHGILQHYNIGQSEFLWSIRTHPKMLEFYRTLYSRQDLIVSFDGANLSKPPKRTLQPWPHIDQGSRRLGFQCLQGYVTLVTGQNAGTVIYPRSHFYHSLLFEKFPELKGPKDWVRLNSEHMNFLEAQGIKQTLIQPRPGQLMIWDSRLVHYGSPPLTNYRLAAYVTYVPREWANQQNLEKRRKAFMANRTTSHWPHKVRLVPRNPQTRGKAEILEKWPALPGALWTPEINQLI